MIRHSHQPSAITTHGRWGAYLLWCALAGSIALACNTDGNTATDAGPLEDPTDRLFDPDHVLEIEVTLAPEDWDLIRHQERTVIDILGVGCLEAPFESPFTYVPGTVTVDGITLENTGVRKKGFLGSLDDEKPSLKLKFDEYVGGQNLFGVDRLTLNNAKQDPSLIRPCLAYGVFREAGLPASRCNFARVTVNGNELGIYANVESVKKQFLGRHFESADGALYEGTLSDFREGWTATFEKKTDKDEPGGDEIAELTAALESEDGQLLSAIDPLVDVEQFLSFWAAEVLIGHWDGYTGNTNNYFVYHDPTSDQFQFIPWGIDAVLGEVDETPEIESVFATSILAHRLYLLPETQQRYVGRLRELLDTVWDETALIDEVDRMETLIAPYTDDEVAAAIEEVRDFVESQRATIDEELVMGPPEWNQPLRDEICFEEIGEIEATFSTTFGTLEAENPFLEGSGTVSGSYDDTTIEPDLVGVVAGFDEESEDGEGVAVALIARQPDETFLLVYILTQAELLTGGAVLEVDWSDTLVLLVAVDPETEEDELIGAMGGGTVELDQAASVDGAIVTGQLAGPLVYFPF